jgi:hypothetical protein
MDCLACSSLTQVLRRGSCVSANCQGSNGVIPRLGLCLSELLQKPASLPSGSETLMPVPTVTNPTTPIPPLKLTWWQIFLMTLGCAFILIVLIWCWRRKTRKHREKKTNSFARAKDLDGGWLSRWGQRLFRNKREIPLTYGRSSLYSPKIHPIEDDMMLRKLAPPTPAAKKLSTKKRNSMDELISAYEHSPTPSISSVDRVSRSRSRWLRRRIDRYSHALYSGKQRSGRDRREQNVPVPVLSKKALWNSEGVLVNRFNVLNQASMRAVRPGVSPQSTPSRFPKQTYIAPPSFAREIHVEPKSSGAVTHYTGGTRMPAIHTGNDQGPYPLLPVPTLQQFHERQPLYMGTDYSTALPHNPFRNRGI